MILWAKVRRLWLLAITLCGLGVALVLLRGQAVVVPTVVGGGATALLWATFLPLGWASALCAVYDDRGAQAEWRARPRLAVLDAGLFVCASAALFGVLFLSSTHEVWVQVAAHALILSSLATLVTVVGDAGKGIMAATTLLLVTSSYSLHMAGAKYVRLLQPEGDASFSMVVGAALAVAATWVLATGSLRSEAQ